MFELKLDTDIVAFENELKRFAACYPKTGGLQDVYVGEVLGGDARPIDETGHPVEQAEGRYWAIQFKRYDPARPWVSTSDADFFLCASRIGGDFPLLLRVIGYAQDERPFVVAFLERCKGLWKTTPVGDRVGGDKFGGGEAAAASVQEISVEEIDSFKKVAEVSASEVSDLVPLQVPEADIKRMLREIIGEPFDQKDWSGETSDLFTMRVMFQGRRAPTAFLLKGPSVKGTLHIANLGKRGNQGQRLFREPASLYVIQHVDKIDSAVRDLIQMLATRKSKEIEAPMCYCLIDGVDLARLLVAYGKLKPSEDLT